MSFGFGGLQLKVFFFFFFSEKKDHKLSLNQTSQNRLEVHYVTVVEHYPFTLNNRLHV